MVCWGVKGVRAVGFKGPGSSIGARVDSRVRCGMLFLLCLGGGGNGFKIDKQSLMPSFTFQVFSRSTPTASRGMGIPFSSRLVSCGL